tara:strand:+ start:482 stop:1297 length:816 start_codon:yes stop_codon:yes gene_type:complete
LNLGVKVVEIPDYLLERSREARARFQGTDAEPVEQTAAIVESSASNEETVPVKTEAPEAELEKVEPPKPIAPWVEAAKNRKKIPVWMAPVALFLPIWAFMIWGTLEEPSSHEEGPIAAGGEIYNQCATCHGAGGGGGVGYQLNEGEVVKTFPDVESHIAWVVNGSSAAGTPYGDPMREDSQRISQAQGVMPGFASLDSLQILEVVLYERVTHGLQSPESLEAYVIWAESGDLPVWEAGVYPQLIASSFDEFLESNAEAEEAYEEALEEATG